MFIPVPPSAKFGAFKNFLSFSCRVETPSSAVTSFPRRESIALNQGRSTPARTIMLVEDEAALATEIKAELEEHDYTVRLASIGEAADAARTSGAAMLILDRLLHGLDS